MAEKPEERARAEIDRLLAAAGWSVQSMSETNIHAARGVAIREFPLKTGHGFADYLLYIDAKAAGVIEAKKEGVTLTGVETQSARYAQGLPDELPAWNRPLPFSYQSTGVETHFTNGLNPEPRSRPTFAFHRPDSLRLTAYVAEEDIPDEPLSRNKLMRTFVEMKLHRDSEAPLNSGGNTGRSPIVEGWSFEKRIATSLSLMCGAAGAMTSQHGQFVGLAESCTLAQAASKANLLQVEFDELAVVLNSLLEFDRSQQPSSFDRRRLVFSHRAFQEFFLARYILDHEEEFAGLKLPMEVTSWLDGEKVK